jgi:uncharacterized protein YgiM (DUF1202 family)
MKRAIILLMLSAAVSAHAETAYVTERLTTTLRSTQVEGSPAVKSLESGAALEVLERVERMARVRDAQGAEGWIESRFLAATPPARAQLERMQAELAKARSDLTASRARIGELEAKLAQESPRVEPARPSANPPVAMQAPSVDDNDFPWGWLVLAFAMLWIGFGAGIVWLRERHRKKLGGMYLRV